MLLNRASVAWSGAECPCNVDILVHYFKFVRITKTFFTYFVGMYLGHVQKCYFCAFFYVYSFIVNIIKLIIESF